jgi:BirA family transcriptional regulator, biotin operon repressor / biotin---[acetyl-CoA-carboxylase] ligase
MNIALLDRLKAAGGGFVPIGGLGPDLDELEAFGFGIERHPYLGAAYRGPAAKLCPDQIEWELGTKVVGRRVAVWSRVGSTNDLAAKASSSPSNEGLVVLAEEQSSGRGSRGRSWSAPAGSSILMSVLLFPPIPLQDSAWLTALSAVAVAEAVAMVGLEGGGDPIDARIKWPNDVRVGRRKLAGILVERGQGTVLGIGINVNIDRDDFPEDLRDSATSLRTLLGRTIDRSELVRSIIRNLDRHYDASIVYGPDYLGGRYRLHSEHLWHDVDVTTPSGIVGGRLGNLDLRMGLEVGHSSDDRRAIPMKDVLAIANRAGSRRWTSEEYELNWWPGLPDANEAITGVERSGGSAAGPIGFVRNNPEGDP